MSDPIIPSAQRETPDKEAALAYLFTRWDQWTVSDLGPHLTCGEAEALCDVFAAHGQHDLADALRKGHVEGDEEGDDDHSGGA